MHFQIEDFRTFSGVKLFIADSFEDYKVSQPLKNVSKFLKISIPPKSISVLNVYWDVQTPEDFRH